MCRLVTVGAILLLAAVGGGVQAGAARLGASGVSEQRVALTSGKVVTPGFAIGFVGVLWDGSARGGKVRFRTKDRWTAWQPLRQDEIEVSGRFASTLMFANGATSYQVRLPKLADRARAVAMNTTATRSDNRATAAASDIITRAGWGADETLRFNAQGEIWPPAYYPVQTITVHHTATQNGDSDPAATVRAIYRYHAIDQGWGDIGYQYLIDEQGRVYEGRYSGDDLDPAHDRSGQMVTAAHVGGWNSGNLGIALLGNLRTKQPTAAARASLEKLLAELAARHGLDPQAKQTYLNPVNGTTKYVDVISGHRDWDSTECPGTTFYKQLPSVRTNVAALIAPEPTETIHATDLEGIASSQGRTWTAAVTITVADGSGAAVDEATVTGTWTSGASSTCRTTSNGSCVVSLDRLRNNVTSTTFTLTALTKTGLTYDSSMNVDADDDSTGSAFTVTKP